MTTYDLKNDYDRILRIIIEPEAIEYDLKPNEQATVVVIGGSSAFQCKHFVDKEGINCIAFWPDRGTVEISFDGRNIVDLV